MKTLTKPLITFARRTGFFVSNSTGGECGSTMTNHTIKAQVIWNWSILPP